ncbi:MAG: flagellar export chaperone FlgN [Spirochaetes bacterium]|nr:flagellar export chaperone FlgN [Spirochaetota bacterium]
MKTQIMSREMPVEELVIVLRDELAAHHKLLQLEMAKREAIVARDGELLKTSAGEQAAELVKIDLLESRREKISRKIIAQEQPGEIRLTDIIASTAVSAPEKKELGRYQSALRAALVELKKLSDINARMLVDSRDLFKEMLASLAGRNLEYGGVRTRPVLVDANC